MNEIDWPSISQELDSNGYATLSGLIDRQTCKKVWQFYDDPTVIFRSTIDMARYNFGKGAYKYFDYPLPDEITRLRVALYPPLADIANEWNRVLGNDDRWPKSLVAFKALCDQTGQSRSTSLLLNYGPGDFNCLHQDLYGEVYFPLQLVVMLSDPSADFSGGELTLVEQRPRMQSRPIVIPLKQGDAAIIPVRERPRQGKQRFYRVQIRHGVSEVRSGQRRTLGIIFHDAK